MGLIGNGTRHNKSFARYTGGNASVSTSPSALRSTWTKPSISLFINLPKTESVTVGYGWNNAIRMAISEGGIASTSQIHGTGSFSADALSVKLSTVDISGSGSISNASLTVLLPASAAVAGTGTISNAPLTASSQLVSALTGTGSISASLNMNVPIASSLSGIGSASADGSGYGSLSADISPFTELSPESLAASVLNALLVEYNETGSVGEALNNIGAAGNPWSALLSSNNDPGSFGERVQKLLTTNKFIGLK